MSTKAEILAKFDSETGGDIIVILEEAMQRDIARLTADSQILTRGHLGQFDTTSMTEKITETVGFFKTIGKNRSLKLAEALHQIAQAETRIIEEISNRPYKLFSAYTALLRKIIDDLYYVEKVKLERQKLLDQNLLRRQRAVLDEVGELVKAYQVIDPERAKRARQNFNEADEIFSSDVEKISDNDTLSKGEKDARYEEALDAFILRMRGI